MSKFSLISSLKDETYGPKMAMLSPWKKIPVAEGDMKRYNTKVFQKVD
jgi:hypothetical protein